MSNFSPGTGALISTVEVATQATIDAAVASAQAAFPAWSALSGAERGRILTRAAVLIREYNSEMSLLESVDAGIPVSETEFVQVLGGADCFEYYGGLASNACVTGQMMDTPHAGGHKDSFCYTRREPLGVCAGIGAWNYPVLVMSWKVAPALACGNTFVYKPSECTPLTALKIAEILKEAGLPDGVFNVVVGDRTTGPMLTRHSDVKKLSFTGSTETGIRIVKEAAETLKKVTMELGGKSPLLVFEDADVDNAVGAAMMSNWYTQGEICSNATRVFVHKSVKEEFVRKLVERTKQLKVGDPLDPSTHVGAMIMPPDNKTGHMDRVVGYIERAKADPRNKLILGGNTHTIEVAGGKGGSGNEGCYVEPTIFECSDDNSELVKEEVFGPVMSILEFEDEADAVERANDTVYGLGAGIMTNNLARAHRVAKQFQSGNVWINNYNLTPSEMPFGGYGMSGYGRECGTYAIDNYTQIKNVYVEMGDVDSSCYP
ncbi:hypothetical protein TrST_g3564 [Triparma strigata]|uniref:Aldehyde dehydrogenase domain-containing protein n=1 Tax=Triparma strigata TaxID=1606541 RepID=A0A9W7ASK9_9STRA|nr:hypothetical protein TrST_g3564 [Triparma strigata]